MTATPRWLVFGVGLLLLIGLWERYPKVGVPLTIIIAMAVIFGNPQVLPRLGFKQGGGSYAGL